MKENQRSEKRIAVVTGATGTIGAHVVQLLLEQNWHVRILSRGSKEVDKRVEVILGSLANTSALVKLADSADAVFHCAAEIYDDSTMREVNVDGTANLLKVLAHNKLKYFCHISSAIVVGPSGPTLISEDTVCEPKTEYEKTKWEGEQLVRKWNACDRICILRPADGIDKTSLGTLTLGTRNNSLDRVKVLLQGKVNAHIVHVEDVASAALFFVGQDFMSPACFFVSNDEDEENTVGSIYAICRSEQSGKNVAEPFSLPAFVPNMMRRLKHGKSLHVNARFSSAKLRNCGFKFKYGLRDGVIDIFKQYNDIR